MKRYAITLLVPSTKEVIVHDAQGAHNEATKLVEAAPPRTILQTIEYVGECEAPDPMLFDI